jgi:hypothetical protein
MGNHLREAGSREGGDHEVACLTGQGPASMLSSVHRFFAALHAVFTVPL